MASEEDITELKQLNRREIRYNLFRIRSSFYFFMGRRSN